MVRRAVGRAVGRRAAARRHCTGGHGDGAAGGEERRFAGGVVARRLRGEERIFPTRPPFKLSAYVCVCARLLGSHTPIHALVPSPG